MCRFLCPRYVEGREYMHRCRLEGSGEFPRWVSDCNRNVIEVSTELRSEVGFRVVRLVESELPATAIRAFRKEVIMKIYIKKVHSGDSAGGEWAVAKLCADPRLVLLAPQRARTQILAQLVDARMDLGTTATNESMPTYDIDFKLYPEQDHHDDRHLELEHFQALACHTVILLKDAFPCECEDACVIPVSAGPGRMVFAVIDVCTKRLVWTAHVGLVRKCPDRCDECEVSVSLRGHADDGFSVSTELLPNACAVACAEVVVTALAAGPPPAFEPMGYLDKEPEGYLDKEPDSPCDGGYPDREPHRDGQLPANPDRDADDVANPDRDAIVLPACLDKEAEDTANPDRDAVVTYPPTLIPFIALAAKAKLFNLYTPVSPLVMTLAPLSERVYIPDRGNVVPGHTGDCPVFHVECILLLTHNHIS